MDKIVKNLRRTYEHLITNQRLTTNDVRYSIVCNVLLKQLGYDALDFDFEGSGDKSRYDMAVRIDEKERLLIKTKSIYTKLTQTYIDQLIADIHESGLEWGLLTNGREYILLSSKTDPPQRQGDAVSPHAVVFWFDIYKSRDREKNSLKYFRYLGKEQLFSTRTTYYFRDIAQYRTWYLERHPAETWRSQKNTLYQFFDFVARGTKQYEGLGQISSDDFKSFVAHKQESSTRLRTMISKDSIHSHFSHISAMLGAFKEKKKIAINLDSLGDDVLAISAPKKKEDISHLNAENISRIIELYSKKDNAIRNITIFLLCVSIGIDRSSITELKWRDFDPKKNTITIGGRNIKLNRALSKYLNELQNEQAPEQAQTGYVFTAFHKGKYKPVSESTINDVFDRLYEYDNDETWRLFSPAYVRRGLIEQLFRCNYTLDEIVYITGLKPGSISKYITMERIISRQANNTPSKRLPLFDGVLDKE